jgi:alanyl-tRNA synthetase
MEGYLLGKKVPFLHTLVPAVVAGMKYAYPEIAETVQSVSNVIKLEEEQFLDVVDVGCLGSKSWQPKRSHPV